MGKAPTPRSGRQKGGIDELPSGALRVRVYAGVDPVTKRRHDLIEVVPAGPNAADQADAVRSRLVAEVAERRNPRTSATLDQLLERYLDQFDGSPNTLKLYRGYVKNHISPLLGSTKVGALDAEMLDSFYAELRRCRKHCTKRRGMIDHRVASDHDCDARCRPHQCRPLDVSTVRHMHYILSGAYKKAVRWRWVAVSPVAQGAPPAAPKENPSPPTPAEAARILMAAYRDADWGTLLWVAMTTGARRGEVCAIRWSAVNLDEGRETIWLRHGIRKAAGGGWEEASLKTHQQRRIALDSETVAALVEHRQRCEQRAASLGVTLQADAFLFSDSPNGSTFTIPDTVTQRYERLARRLAIVTTLHKLRHYSATELILAGVDVRTVAGRLGHAGGGTTTLRTYTAWVSEADQRAAAGWTTRMPARAQLEQGRSWASANPRHPYERVAVDLARRIEAGELTAGEPAPTAAVLADEHGISLATARRAVALTKDWGLIVTDAAGRPRIAAQDGDDAPAEPASEPPPSGGSARYWSVVVTGPGGFRCAPRMVKGDLADPGSFRSHLVGIVRAERPDLSGQPESAWIGQYELCVKNSADAAVETILRLG